MQRFSWWTIWVEAGIGLASGALTYWIMASAPWMPRRVAAVGAGAALFIYSIVLLCVHRIRKIRGAIVPAEGAAAVAQRSPTYAMAGGIVALLGGACLILGVYGLYQGDLRMSVLSIGASGGLVSLALWLIKRGLPR